MQCHEDLVGLVQRFYEDRESSRQCNASDIGRLTEKFVAISVRTKVFRKDFTHTGNVTVTTESSLHNIFQEIT